MTRISNTEQVLLLLRAHLQRTGRQRRTSRAGPAGASRRSPVERLRELAGDGELPRQEIGRALLAGLLADDLGEGAINDPSFQRVLDEVQRRVAGDKDAKQMLDRAVDQLLSQRENG